MDNPAPWRIAVWSGKVRNYRREGFEAMVGAPGVEDFADARERLGTSYLAPCGYTAPQHATCQWRSRQAARFCATRSVLVELLKDFTSASEL